MAFPSHFYKRNASTEYNLSAETNRFFPFLETVILEISYPRLTYTVVAG
jgi:hypothetical protein